MLLTVVVLRRPVGLRAVAGAAVVLCGLVLLRGTGEHRLELAARRVRIGKATNLLGKSDHLPGFDAQLEDRPPVTFRSGAAAHTLPRSAVAALLIPAK